MNSGCKKIQFATVKVPGDLTSPLSALRFEHC